MEAKAIEISSKYKSLEDALYSKKELDEEVLDLINEPIRLLVSILSERRRSFPSFIPSWTSLKLSATASGWMMRWWPPQSPKVPLSPRTLRMVTWQTNEVYLKLPNQRMPSQMRHIWRRINGLVFRWCSLALNDLCCISFPQRGHFVSIKTVAPIGNFYINYLYYYFSSNPFLHDFVYPQLGFLLGIQHFYHL